MQLYLNVPIILINEKAHTVHKAAFRINAYPVHYLITFNIQLAGPEFASL